MTGVPVAPGLAGAARRRARSIAGSDRISVVC